MNNNTNIVLIRVARGMGIDRHANGYALDGTPLPRKVYNGRLCYIHNGKRIGYATLAATPPVKLLIDNSIPF
jgi:hypothetical protein